ncbi:MAG: hypothetical protein IPN26_11995 [Bacteroidetes bacterium]|nr:hypothetical protein [Bacteroidota bacterium]
MKDFQKYMDFNVKAKEAFISCGRLEDTLAVILKWRLPGSGWINPKEALTCSNVFYKIKELIKKMKNYAIALDNLSNAYYRNG